MAAREKWIKSNSKFFLLSCVGDLSKNEVVVNRALSQQQIAIQIVIV